MDIKKYCQNSSMDITAVRTNELLWNGLRYSDIRGNHIDLEYYSYLIAV